MEAFQGTLWEKAMGESTSRAHTILLVEDNPADIKIAQRGFEGSGAQIDLLVARDAQQALRYLLRKGRFSPDYQGGEDLPPPMNWRRPDLIFLDLNLPGKTGLELLEEIRGIPEYRPVPILVLTTSPRPQDVQRAYALGASTYFEKPASFEKFIHLLDVILRYWLEMALLPHS